MGYTRFVRLAKVVLPLVALTMVGMVIVRLSGDPFKNAAPPPEEAQSTPGQIELIGAQYEGVDDAGRPYTLIAHRASRAIDAQDTVLLETVRADITLEDTTWLALHARTGTYDTKTQNLHLSGDVAVYHDSGYEMHLDDIAIDLKSHQAATRQAVRGHGPLGEISAPGLSVTDAGNTVIFSGPAKMQLRMTKAGAG